MTGMNPSGNLSGRPTSPRGPILSPRGHDGYESLEMLDNVMRNYRETCSMMQEKEFLNRVEKTMYDDENIVQWKTGLNPDEKEEQQKRILTRWQQRLRDWEKIESTIRQRLKQKIISQDDTALIDPSSTSHTNITRATSSQQTLRSNLLNKRPLMMMTQDEHRHRLEAMALLKSSLPQRDTTSEISWQASLRGGGPVRVALGNIFSGLEADMEPDKSAYLDPGISKRTGKHGKIKIIRNVTWSDLPSAMNTSLLGTSGGITNDHIPTSEFLTEKMTSSDSSSSISNPFYLTSHGFQRMSQPYISRMKTIRPHEIDKNNINSLVIQSESLFDWAEKSSNEYFHKIREKFPQPTQPSTLFSRMSTSRVENTFDEKNMEITSSQQHDDRPLMCLEYHGLQEIILEGYQGDIIKKKIILRNSGRQVIYWHATRLPNITNSSSNSTNKVRNSRKLNMEASHNIDLKRLLNENYQLGHYNSRSKEFYSIKNLDASILQRCLIDKQDGSSIMIYPQQGEILPGEEIHISIQYDMKRMISGGIISTNWQIETSPEDCPILVMRSDSTSTGNNNTSISTGTTSLVSRSRFTSGSQTYINENITNGSIAEKQFTGFISMNIRGYTLERDESALLRTELNDEQTNRTTFMAIRDLLLDIVRSVRLPYRMSDLEAAQQALFLHQNKALLSEFLEDCSVTGGHFYRLPSHLTMSRLSYCETLYQQAYHVWRMVWKRYEETYLALQSRLTAACEDGKEEENLEVDIRIELRRRAEFKAAKRREALMWASEDGYVAGDADLGGEKEPIVAAMGPIRTYTTTLMPSLPEKLSPSSVANENLKKTSKDCEPDVLVVGEAALEVEDVENPFAVRPDEAIELRQRLFPYACIECFDEVAEQSLAVTWPYDLERALRQLARLPMVTAAVTELEGLLLAHSRGWERAGRRSVRYLEAIRRRREAEEDDEEDEEDADGQEDSDVDDDDRPWILNLSAEEAAAETAAAEDAAPVPTLETLSTCSSTRSLVVGEADLESIFTGRAHVAPYSPERIAEEWQIMKAEKLPRGVLGLGLSLQRAVDAQKGAIWGTLRCLLTIPAQTEAVVDIALSHVGSALSKIPDIDNELREKSQLPPDVEIKPLPSAFMEEITAEDGSTVSGEAVWKRVLASEESDLTAIITKLGKKKIDPATQAEMNRIREDLYHRSLYESIRDVLIDVVMEIPSLAAPVISIPAVEKVVDHPHLNWTEESSNEVSSPFTTPLLSKSSTATTVVLPPEETTPEVESALTAPFWSTVATPRHADVKGQIVFYSHNGAAFIPDPIPAGVLTHSSSPTSPQDPESLSDCEARRSESFGQVPWVRLPRWSSAFPKRTAECSQLAARVVELAALQPSALVLVCDTGVGTGLAAKLAQNTLESDWSSNLADILRPLRDSSGGLLSLRDGLMSWQQEVRRQWHDYWRWVHYRRRRGQTIRYAGTERTLRFLFVSSLAEAQQRLAAFLEDPNLCGGGGLTSGRLNSGRHSGRKSSVVSAEVNNRTTDWLQTNLPVFIIENLRVPNVVPNQAPYTVEDSDDEAFTTTVGETEATQAAHTKWSRSLPHKVQVQVSAPPIFSLLTAPATSTPSDNVENSNTVSVSVYCDVSQALKQVVDVTRRGGRRPIWVDGSASAAFSAASAIEQIAGGSGASSRVPRFVDRVLRDAFVWLSLLEAMPQRQLNHLPSKIIQDVHTPITPFPDRQAKDVLVSSAAAAEAVSKNLDIVGTTPAPRASLGETVMKGSPFQLQDEYTETELCIATNPAHRPTFTTAVTPLSFSHLLASLFITSPPKSNIESSTTPGESTTQNESASEEPQVVTNAGSSLFILGGELREGKFRVLEGALSRFSVVYLAGEFAIPFLCSRQNLECSVELRRGRGFLRLAQSLLEKARLCGTEIILPSDLLVAHPKTEGMPSRSVLQPISGTSVGAMELPYEGLDTDGELQVVDLDSALAENRRIVTLGTVVDIGPKSCATMEAMIAASQIICIWGLPGQSELVCAQASLTSLATALPGPLPPIPPTGKVVSTPVDGLSRRKYTFVFGTATNEWLSRRLDPDGEGQAPENAGYATDLMATGGAVLAMSESCLLITLLGQTITGAPAITKSAHLPKEVMTAVTTIGSKYVFRSPLRHEWVPRYALVVPPGTEPEEMEDEELSDEEDSDIE